VGLRYSTALGVLLRSIVVEREPIYRQQETVRSFAPAAYGLSPKQVDLLSDDRIGRALDHLFDPRRDSQECCVWGWMASAEGPIPAGVETDILHAEGV
jgi:hypothetical protein